jgi:hypothetical protein
MHITKVTQKPALAGFAPVGKPDHANRQEPSCYTKSSIRGLRLVVAIAVLSVSASWTAFGQTQEGPAAQSQPAPAFSVLYAFTGGRMGDIPNRLQRP